MCNGVLEDTRRHTVEEEEEEEEEGKGGRGRQTGRRKATYHDFIFCSFFFFLLGNPKEP
jgi:hypothetical protein